MAHVQIDVTKLIWFSRSRLGLERQIRLALQTLATVATLIPRRVLDLSACTRKPAHHPQNATEAATLKTGAALIFLGVSGALSVTAAQEYW
jgi:hypothetical protein